MRPLKVLFANRYDALTHQGGDTVQMLKTKEFLERNYDLKIEVCLNEEEFKQHSDADIVHIFNIQTIDESLRYMELCKQYNKKVALSTIYWDLSHYIYNTFLTNWFNLHDISKRRYYYKDQFINFKKVIGKITNKGDQYGSKDYVQKRRAVIEAADILLPNSDEELRIIEKEFGFSNLDFKSIVVPNAVDLKEGKSDGQLPEVIRHLKDYILQVGRIEPTKNQLSVIKALIGHPEIPIVIVGRAHNEKYFHYLKTVAEKRGNVYFINQVQHDEVYTLYKHAAVHVNPSFRESPGLSSLEALYSGCNIVVSSIEYCPIDYYQFDKYGEICNPYDYKSIEAAILKAMKKERVILPVDYFAAYSYQRAAEKTYMGYEQLINKNN